MVRVVGAQRCLRVIALAVLAATLTAVQGSDAAALGESSDSGAALAAVDPAADLGPAQCPAMFGNSVQRKANELYRTDHLQDVIGQKGSYTVVHHDQRWTKPARLSVKGLRLLELNTDNPESAFMRVALDRPTAARFACQPGVYRLTRDDALAPGAAILAITDTLALVARNGKLSYLPLRPRQTASFRMIWQSSWTISVQTDSSGSSGSSMSNNASRRPPSRPSNSMRPPGN